MRSQDAHKLLASGSKSLIDLSWMRSCARACQQRRPTGTACLRTPCMSSTTSTRAAAAASRALMMPQTLPTSRPPCRLWASTSSSKHRCNIQQSSIYSKSIRLLSQHMPTCDADTIIQVIQICMAPEVLSGGRLLIVSRLDLNPSCIVIASLTNRECTFWLAAYKHSVRFSCMPIMESVTMCWVV